jgi:hypothetical protein
MLITPRPGVDPKGLLETLRNLRNRVVSLRGGGQAGNAYGRLLAYLEWTSEAVGMLGNQISSADLASLVLTSRYAHLLGGVGNMTSVETEVQRVVNGLVSLELDERAAVFDAAVTELERRRSVWEGVRYFVAADTSFYIHHPVKFRDIDLAALTGLNDGSIQLLIPILVVDELDGLKRSKDKDTRWRAGHTLGVLDELFRGDYETAQLRPANVEIQRTTGVRQGEVNVEIVYDPPGHVRLPINDDEIVDRAVAMKSLAGREVTFVTYDTGQSSRGRRAGLKVVKLNQPEAEEPLN